MNRRKPQDHDAGEASRREATADIRGNNERRAKESQTAKGNPEPRCARTPGCCITLAVVATLTAV
jgi:hypothetical protein